jgi:hypothetical protein
MELSTTLFEDLSLRIADRSIDGGRYPIARLPKGLLLLSEGQDLAEEGVGFGVPVLKQGARTIFPGWMELAQRREGADWEVTATFRMNLVERLAGPDGGSPTSRSFYAVRDSLAALHRRLPPLRGFLTATSNAVRRRLGWVTTFEETKSHGTLNVTYGVSGDRDRVGVVVDLTGLPKGGITDVVVMNELGARHFDRYVDSDGTCLRGAEIGTWDKVAAEKATLMSAASGVAFSLRQVEGARLYRGWELVGSRLAWSGFGYSLQPSVESFSYDVSIERMP